MRREIYRMDRASAVDLLRRAPMVHLATSTPDGTPVLRTVHGVVVGNRVCFHGAPAGEKAETFGRPCVLAAEEVVAEIPSWFVDPERACPATTYFESAQVHGTLDELTDPAEKARVLQALMEKFQPEGRHVPITAEDSRYRGAVKGIAIVGVSLERLDGKRKLGQNRTPEELAKILEQLWRRGSVRDVAAIEKMRRANLIPSPPFLAAPDGATLHCALPPEDAADAAQFLTGAYWNLDVTPDRIAAAHLGATAWVGAKDAEGRLIASARALSDGAKHAWIYDVIVAESWRRRGLALAVMRLLLDHPAVRGAKKVWLGTRDAQALYRRFGFASAPPRPAEWDMLLERDELI